jgi:acyl-CoA thioester hydrolase
VVDVRCRYKMPARYDDLICVRTSLLNVRESFLRFGYHILRDSDQALLAEGETVHLVVGADMKRTALPKKYLVPFLQAAAAE